jgi:hypothetical protein
MFKIVRNKSFLIVLLCALCGLQAMAEKVEYTGHRHELSKKDVILYFREAPNFNSPVTDTMSAHTATTGIYTVDFFIVLSDESVPKAWRKVALIKAEIYTKNKKGDKECRWLYSIVRYIDDNSFRKNVLAIYFTNYFLGNDGRLVNLYAQPNENAAVVEKIPKGKELLLSYTNDDQWFTYPKIKKGVSYTYYVNKKNLEESARPSDMTYEAVYEKENSSITEKISDLLDHIGIEGDGHSLPYWILCLTIFCWLCKFLGIYPRLRLGLQYLSMTAVFVMTIVYFGLFGKGMWWCDFFQKRWWEATLFFILTAVLIYIQFKNYFSVVKQIREFSRPVNLYIGILILGILTVLALVYSLFAGWNSDWNGGTSIVIAAVFAIQLIVIVVQLRKYPLLMLMALIFVPLGVCALLLVSVKFFIWLVFVAIIVLAIAAFVGGVGNGRGVSLNSGNNAARPYQCELYDSTGDFCLHDGDGIHLKNCTYVKTGECQFGKRW